MLSTSIRQLKIMSKAFIFKKCLNKSCCLINLLALKWLKCLPKFVFINSDISASKIMEVSKLNLCKKESSNCY